MRIVVLLNADAGTLQRNPEAFVQRVRGALERHGVEPDVRLVPGARIREEARRAVASAPDVVVAGGGDGTIRAVAEALVGTDVALAVLPLGTLNHFARDNAVPPDVEAALEVAIGGQARARDVAFVNGRVFLNNTSIGLYPHVVRDRELWQERLGWGKWRSFAVALVRVFKRFPLLRVRLFARRTGGERLTPVVLVGNNEYELGPRGFGARRRLDGGQLYLYVVRATSRLSMLWMAARVLFRRARGVRDFEVRALREVWIHSRRRQLRVALDGEVERLTPPLHFRIAPRGLRVMVPETAP